MGVALQSVSCGVDGLEVEWVVGKADELGESMKSTRRLVAQLERLGHAVTSTKQPDHLVAIHAPDTFDAPCHALAS